MGNRVVSNFLISLILSVLAFLSFFTPWIALDRQGLDVVKENLNRAGQSNISTSLDKMLNTFRSLSGWKLMTVKYLPSGFLRFWLTIAFITTIIVLFLSIVNALPFPEASFKRWIPPIQLAITLIAFFSLALNVYNMERLGVRFGIGYLIRAVTRLQWGILLALIIFLTMIIWSLLSWYYRALGGEKVAPTPAAGFPATTPSSTPDKSS